MTKIVLAERIGFSVLLASVPLIGACSNTPSPDTPIGTPSNQKDVAGQDDSAVGQSATADERSAANAVRQRLEATAIAADDLVVEEETDGIITLRGTVSLLLDREKAAEAAARVRGVRAVVNRLEVSPPQATDAEISERVKRNTSGDARHTCGGHCTPKQGFSRGHCG